mgnify:CR=1 FL=1
MANAKQVLDVQVSKGITTAQSNEHLRNRSEKAAEYAMKKGNYDPTREHLNFEIVNGKVRPVDKSRSIPDRMADSLRLRGIKDPNEGLVEPKYRTVVNIILGGSRELMRHLAFGKQDVDFEQGADNSRIVRKPEIEQWAKDAYRFICDKYGEQNIAAFVAHLDEQNPHIHCTLLPIKDGKFAYKEIFAGKDKYEYSARMKQLHSDFAEVNRKWGLARGSSVSESGARHRTTEEYRRMLSEECTTIEEQIATLALADAAASGAAAQGTAFPQFEGSDLEGNPVDNSLFAGNAFTVVNFWFNGCKPCVEELDDLNALNEKVKAQGGEVIGINTETLDGNQQGIDAAKKLLAATGASYRNIYFASGSDAGKFALNIMAFPTTYVFDRDGNVVGQPLLGGIDKEENLAALQKNIDAALAKDNAK